MGVGCVGVHVCSACLYGCVFQPVCMGCVCLCVHSSLPILPLIPTLHAPPLRAGMGLTQPGLSALHQLLWSPQESRGSCVQSEVHDPGCVEVSDHHQTLTVTDHHQPLTITDHYHRLPSVPYHHTLPSSPYYH